MLPEETQWNDAQIRFGDYDSKCNNSNNNNTRDGDNNNDNIISSSSSSSESNNNTNNKEIFGASGDLHLDQEHFTFIFPIKDIIPTTNKEVRIELQGYQSESNITYCSTGLTMWPAAEKLCNHLVSHPTLIQSKRILELGSGLGLCGLLAYHITDDTAKVYMTDGDTDTLGYLRKNIQTNLKKNDNKHKAGNEHNDDDVLSCHQLLWSQENASTFLSDKANNEKFDVILASDTIYNICVLQPMWDTIQTLLNVDGIVLLAFARRQVAVSIDQVLEAGVNAGFEYEECEETSLEDNLFVYIFRWKKN